MNAVVQKICVGCGNDVATQKRVKDPSGRYFCHACWNSASRKSADAPRRNTVLADQRPPSHVSEIRPTRPEAIPTASTTVSPPCPAKRKKSLWLRSGMVTATVAVTGGIAIGAHFFLRSRPESESSSQSPRAIIASSKEVAPQAIASISTSTPTTVANSSPTTLPIAAKTMPAPADEPDAVHPVAAMVAAHVQQKAPERIDLLRMVDPVKDSITGSWNMDNGSLMCPSSGVANIEFRYAPPSEYDFRAVFTLQTQQDSLMLICCGGGHQFAWVLGRTGCGFSAVNGKNATSNETTNKNIMLATGHRYTTVVQVRRDGIAAYLDDKLVSSLKTDFSNLSLYKEHKLRQNDTIGLSVSRDAAKFEVAEVTLVGPTSATEAQRQDRMTPSNNQPTASAIPDADPVRHAKQLYDSGCKSLQAGDISNGRAQLEESAKLGSADAMCELGVLYLNGTGVQKDENQAVVWFQKSADLNGPLGINNLAVMYQNGTGIGKDEEKAFELYTKSAELGEAIAMENVGNCYDQGIGVHKDIRQALTWYQLGANAGNALSMWNIGVIYQQGKRGIKGNGALASEWFHKAANAGYAPAQDYLAQRADAQRVLHDKRERAKDLDTMSDDYIKSLIADGTLLDAKKTGYGWNHGFKRSDTLPREPRTLEKVEVYYDFTFVTQGGLHRTYNGHIVLRWEQALTNDLTQGTWIPFMINIDGQSDRDIK